MRATGLHGRVWLVMLTSRMDESNGEKVTRRQAVAGGLAGAAVLAAGAAVSTSSDGGEVARSTTRMPVAFVPHGGGPMSYVEMGFDAGEVAAIASYWRGLASIPRSPPKALLVISAHWEAPVPTVMTHARPPMLFDYYGFPKAAYALSWPAPGEPALAARVRKLLGGAGFETGADDQRGFDHGTFVPLGRSYPDAKVPAVQLSLTAGLDPSAHLSMGRALAPLRDDGVFIIGSGMSYHNMRGFSDPRSAKHADAFDTWLRDAIASPAATRDQALINWVAAPAARQVHPREEHLLPLMVVAGAAGEDVGRVGFSGKVFGLQISGFNFG